MPSTWEERQPEHMVFPLRVAEKREEASETLMPLEEETTSERGGR